MKYIFLMFITSNVLAADSARIEFIYKNTTRPKQVLTLEKDKTNIICKTESRPAKILYTTKLKNLEFPLKNMKSVDSCENVVVWNYKNKEKKSCFVATQDFVINEILFECYN